MVFFIFLFLILKFFFFLENRVNSFCRVEN